jgi:glycosyltransferase involved in cell wall biosynthesis
MVHRWVGLDPGERMTSVTVIAPGPPWTPGGVERSAGRVTSYLDRWGLDWRCLSCFNEWDVPSNFIRVRGPLRRPADRVAFGWLASWAAVRGHADVIHVQGAEYGWGLGAALAVRGLVRRGDLQRWGGLQGMAGVPPRVVVTCHGTLQSALIKERAVAPMFARWAFGASASAASLIESRVFKYSSLVVCVSDLVGSEVTRLYGVPAGRIRVVPNAVDTDAFTPPLGGLEDRPGYVLWVGRDVRGKGLNDALRIFHNLRAQIPDARLRVVGARREHAPPGVEYLGEQPGGELPHLYAGARLLLCTSFYEADPIAVKEGMACGTPAVVSAAASAFVRHGANGLVVRARPDSADGRGAFVYDAFRLMTDDELWLRLSRGALKGRASLSTDIEEEAYRRVYRELGVTV